MESVVESADSPRFKTLNVYCEAVVVVLLTSSVCFWIVHL